MPEPFSCCALTYVSGDNTSTLAFTIGSVVHQNDSSAFLTYSGSITGLAAITRFLVTNNSTVVPANSTFVATNGTNLTSYTPNVGPNWSVPSGTWYIQGNAAQPNANTDNNFAVVDAGAMGVTVSCQVIPQISGGNIAFPGHRILALGRQQFHDGAIGLLRVWRFRNL